MSDRTGLAWLLAALAISLGACTQPADSEAEPSAAEPTPMMSESPSGDPSAANPAAAIEDPAPESVGYAAAWQDWHDGRIERLQRPDGWLSLVGLHFFEPGRHTVGSATNNDIVLATGPGQLGVIELDAAGAMTFAAAEGVAVSVDGQPVRAPTALVDDVAGGEAGPSVVAFDDGQASFVPVLRSGRHALRVRDSRAETLTEFAGIETWPADPAWQVEARFSPHEAGKTIDIATVINTIEPMDNPGSLEFELEGKPYRLEAIDEGDGNYFLIFADRTNGSESYGAGRFVYAAPAVDGMTTIDFNRAYNPPCALNAFSTCPLPPPENRLDVAVTAGEKKPSGFAH